MKKYSVSEFPWTPEENEILIEAIELKDHNWNQVAQVLYFKSGTRIFRNSKACKEHYMCFLNPDKKK